MRGWRHFVLAVGLAMALAAGWRAAQADELADLRASQALLQQRLDELARGQTPASGDGHLGGVPGAYPGPGAVKPTGSAGLAGSFPRSFRVPGTDTSVRVGGSVELDAGHVFNGGTAR